MNNFLQQLAKYYFNKYQTNISQFCFVFPGRRAGLFFQQHLSKLIKEPLWAPNILTINEFIQTFSPYPVADKITLIFELYNVYNSIYKTGVSFDEFLPWGEIILNDFEDIDKYGADAKQVYSNLLSIKEIEDDYSYLTEEQIQTIRNFWHSFNPNGTSRHQDEFIKIWDRLYDVYLLFNEKLIEKKITYEGYVYKSILNKINNREPLEITCPKIIFVAFNALNISEQKLFHHLHITQKAEFIWDSPLWLHPDKSIKTSPLDTPKMNEAIRFMDENLNNFPSPSDWKIPFNKDLPEIEITSVASDTAQTQVMNELLKSETFVASNEPRDELNSALKNAVVLTDETMLLPVLHTIPEIHEKVNITMGYPLKNTPAYGLLELLFEMQKSCRRTKQGKTWLYFRNVIPILSHQYIEPANTELHKKIIRDITLNNKTYIEAQELNQSKLLGAIFKYVDNNTEFADYIIHLLHTIYYELDKNKEQNLVIEREFLYQLYLTVKQQSDLLKKLGIELEKETWIRLFKRTAELKSIPFNGEPLLGLQLMGILETRALDFENLIILNMNEGVFPQTGATNSLIPYSLRNAFRLPTIEHQDSIFAYYFYRLIHRAKKVHLLYNSSSQGMQTGEMSRFLFQLKYEYPAHKIKFSTAVDAVTIQAPKSYYVTKSDKVMEILNQYLNEAQKKLSPSALSVYFECPLRFYYKYILKAKEPDEITEEIDPRIFGTLFHETVEEIYKELINKEVRKQDIEHLLKHKNIIQEALQSSFNKFFHNQINQSDFSDIQGKNILIYDIILKYIYEFLAVEKQQAPFTLLGLEKEVSSTLTLNNGKKINIGGTIDRLDKKEHTIRIIDYKTGSGEDFFGTCEELFSEEKHKNKKAIFQTLLYSYILNNDIAFAHEKNYSPGVVWIKKIFTSPDYSLKLGTNAKNQPLTLNLVKEEYIEQLKDHLQTLFNPDIPFRQTEYTDSCKACSYSGICGKH